MHSALLSTSEPAGQLAPATTTYCGMGGGGTAGGAATLRQKHLEWDPERHDPGFVPELKCSLPAERKQKGGLRTFHASEYVNRVPNSEAAMLHSSSVLIEKKPASSQLPTPLYTSTNVGGGERGGAGGNGGQLGGLGGLSGLGKTGGPGGEAGGTPGGLGGLGGDGTAGGAARLRQKQS
jgi:hypothetical protein